ncbi:hypothetical protein ABZY16_22720 [Streptomyces sp. NPDC006553]|nr:hypothetical protein [Streptomyces sp. NBC_00233]MCX5229914.1 hypothetical protein [Streptomyces sp. NBC_00233]
MTTPLSVSSRSAGRGPNLILVGAVPVVPALVRAMPYVLADGASV